MKTMEELPTWVTVTKSITYDIASMLDVIAPTTLEALTEMISEWVKEDWSCSCGQEANLRHLIFTDQDGNEL